MISPINPHIRVRLFVIATFTVSFLACEKPVIADDYDKVAPGASEYFEDDKNLLFYLDRDYSKNIVLFHGHYDKGRWKNPVVTSEWLDLGKPVGNDGRYTRSELSRRDRSAYGHQVSAGKNHDEKQMVLTNVPDRKMTVVYDEKLKRPIAKKNIKGIPARLVRVWLDLRYYGKTRIPHLTRPVKHITLIGFEDSTGNVIREKFDP